MRRSRFLSLTLILPTLFGATALCSPDKASAENYSCGPDDIHGKIKINPTLPQPAVDGSTGFTNLCQGGIYAWNAFLALNWPAKPGTRDTPDAAKKFDAKGLPTVWETFRGKVELYPGNGSATVLPHGANQTLPPSPHPYGYDDPPVYVYSPQAVKTATGLVPPCDGQKPVQTPAYVNLDETTQIGNDLLFAGVLKNDANPDNSEPRLVRYAAKMSADVYTKVIQGKYWYISPSLQTSETNYTGAIGNQSQNPPAPYVDLGPTTASADKGKTSVEVKSSWRPLTDAEKASGHFHTAPVRYYETSKAGTTCYREAVWGLVGMHMITFTQAAPWVIWSTFEQADNILAADGKPTEDANGALIPSPVGAPIVVVAPTTPALSSDPSVPAPTVTATGEACTTPGARLYFRENPAYGTLPADQNICVNARWHQIPLSIQQMNEEAHRVIGKDSKSPWLYYKLINIQPIPTNLAGSNDGRFSTTSSYYLANSTIETDYSLGHFTGDLVNGAPSNVTATSGQQPPYTPYYNTQLLPFQALRFFGKPIQMGGCAGCHGFAASQGTDFSFALLGNTVTEPELPQAFALHAFRNYIRR